jgi:NAD(P)-dependent dehydrogenase (short-subunit alcohol dehydrogenase family)
MKSISKEISIRKIRCNSISPAWIDTPMFNKYNETIGTNLEQYNLGIGKPSDVASLAAFLVSDEARWITGQNYILEGGVSNGKYI